MVFLINSQIDFHHLAKPANLANSAVLRMLEEEERSGGKKLKRVAWPPPPETDNYTNEEEQQPVYAKTTPQYQATPISPPQQYNSPSPQLKLNLQQPQNNTSSKGWSHVPSPVATSPQPSFQSPQPFQAPVQPQYQSPPPQFYQPAPHSGLLTLRKEPPIHQAPSPVFISQPATTNFQGGSNMRGDQKWPPASVKAQAEAENRARIELAKGPAMRPRRINKDYSGFFAQHALNSTYPGYKAPPGTQHYYEEPQYPGQSNL
ncbi:pollen-specific leucine-rich repeat extensin-like protein 2 isoform X2 [Chrysoperla carnea]|uniref:pollen-specific leucine-rich repeat extensin-like protein 2 isoform X2 n=1 Tax=Chrysoperla carnea TaxID=189513 RepID=UPI001D05EEC9|nr:pollen-specific leucine-rich repeat extensin-like protein 2 isoform X2 [Chrysoperla carnea]